MVDWKKDMKLSDLLARGKGDEAEGDETKPFHQERITPEVEAQGSVSEEAADVDATEPDETTTPFWKREISFGRRKAETESDFDVETSEDNPEQRPFFARSLGFGRTKDDVSDPDVESPVDETEKTTPFWKRELSFGRRSDEAEADASVEHEFEPDEPEPAAEDLVEDGAEKTPFWKRRKGEATPEAFEQGDSEEAAEDVFDGDEVERKPFWKRELSFGRRRGDETPDDFDEPHEEDDFDADVEKKPFWKRELSFGRRGDDATADDFEEAREETRVEADVESKTPFWKRELSFGRRTDVESPETETTVEPEDLDDAEPEPVAAAAPESHQAIDTPVEREEVPAFVEPEPVAAAVPGAEPVDEMTWVDEVGEADAAQNTAPEVQADQEQSALEPEPVASFVEVEPPEDEAPFTDEPGFAAAGALGDAEALERPADDDAPFWKREIKFGRRKGDADLAQTMGVPLPPVDEDDLVAEAAGSSDTAGTRFWNRGLKFGRGADEASDADFELPSDEEKKPFFKLSLRRAKDPDFDASKPEKRPFYKRELSFRRDKTAGRSSSTRGGRNKQLVGLKVGASQIAAARVVNNGSPELVQLARQSIEQGIVVGGELRDPDALAEALREFFTKYKLPNRNVRLGIGNNRIGVRSFEISGVHDPKQLENAIRFRAQEALPIPLDEAVLDYQVIEESSSPTGIRTYRVLLVVAYRELIDRYVAACRGAGLRLVGIDLEAFALLRALSPPPAEGLPEDTALVAVSIGHDRSTFAVSNGTVCEFTRVLDWGGSSLNTSIARALDITPSQAEPVKRTLSLSENEEGAPAQNNEHTIMAEEAVRLELQTFARELVSSLHFYQNQPGSLAIGNITLTGGTAHLPGLAAELQRLIGVKVRVGDPLRRLKTSQRVETPAQVGSMAVAIGLGIED
jgi:type IV pilus assembly protein PilM